MKTAIISCYFINNYGSVLQAYATQEYLRNIGVDCSTISVEGIKPILKKAKINYFLKNITNCSLLKSKLPLAKLAFARKLNFKNTGKKLASRAKGFAEFRRHFNFSPAPASNFDELKQQITAYNSVVLGGDQLWRPDNIFPGYYTLEWVPDEIRKISLGTSFGVATLDKYSQKRAKAFLPRFDALSVREKSGQDLIFDLTEQKAKVVCDPALLLPAEQWSKIASAKQCPEEEYIFTYFLGSNKKFREFAKSLSNATGLPVVGIPHIDSYLPTDEDIDLPVFDATPEEFLGLIKNAKFVCTDSLHATMFSALFHSNFFAFKRFANTTASTNSRIESFLNKTSLQNRLITDFDEFPLLHRLKADFTAADSAIAEMVADTDGFVKAALNIATQKAVSADA
ncbi:MAG: polysaccharide pyruvyl transferase family protein [Oscillospiraceae bacterium]|jgi:hypothetical protein|nr:polysaccharide pyruvyl transferase family protein [Oscillospiraceae bacterium]